MKPDPENLVGDQAVSVAEPATRTIIEAGLILARVPDRLVVAITEIGHAV
jgi:hypothetical protein